MDGWIDGGWRTREGGEAGTGFGDTGEEGRKGG
jgi:hypothetical protein